MRLIDADELEFFAANYYNDSERLCVLDVVEKMPTVEAEPVRHGRWIWLDDLYEVSCSCSCCSDVVNGIYNYCPHCGAKMDKEDNP